MSIKSGDPGENQTGQFYHTAISAAGSDDEMTGRTCRRPVTIGIVKVNYLP
jgi:hypothetical protein